MDEPFDDKARRARLHELDQILDALEQLNLQDSSEVPEALQLRLAAVGVESRAPHLEVSRLIERIWEIQEQFLQPDSEAIVGLPVRRPQTY
ncbi:MAG: hypothetical protein ACYDGR_04120 [Candidatus Dormibacteria bacterium]